METSSEDHLPVRIGYRAFVPPGREARGYGTFPCNAFNFHRRRIWRAAGVLEPRWGFLVLDCPASRVELPIRRPVCPMSRPDRLSGARFALGRVPIVYPALGSSIFFQNTSILAPSCLCLVPSSLFWRRILYLFPTLSMFAQSSLYLARSCLFLHTCSIFESRCPRSGAGLGHRFAFSPPQGR